MAYLTEKQFDFRSSALPADTFGVVDFKGFEGFSKPYEFEILLVSSDPEIDLTEVLQNPAVITILREEGDIPFNGILSQFEQLHAVVDHVFYRAVLVPRFWWLSLTHHNQIFLDKTVPEIIGEVLEDGGLTTDDYELRISNDYPKWEYICQYRESHQNFVSRWMEREGMYYFFEQTEKGEKLIITDTNLSHTPMAEGKTMYYSPPSGLEEAHREEVISAVVCKQKLLPAKLHVNDYNYRKPSLSLSAEAEVLDKGRGDVHLYGEHFRTPEEGQELARIRAEELLCHEKRFHGESTIPFLRPGYLFELQNHYRESFNQQYLTIELGHEGSQVGYLLAGIQEGLAKVEEQPYYRNSFVTIPSEVQYRHPKTTEKPTFNGTINARIDAEGSGEYAELDEYGRYKVKLPFDVSGRNDGRASHWLRMAQPYGGENQGMHFPLHKHTEVLLTFVEGNPDRPIIAAAVPNPESASPITSATQTKSVISTGKGPVTHAVGAEYARDAITTPNADNYIEFEDGGGSERIRIHSKGDIWLEANERYADYHVGQPAGPPSPTPSPPSAPTNLTITQGAQTQSTPPPTDPPKIGDMLDKFGTGTERATGEPKPYNPTGLQSRHGGATQTFDDAFKQGHVHVSSFDTINTQEGNVYDFGGYWVYNLGNCYIENHLNQKAVLNNDNHPYDLLIQGGPDWMKDPADPNNSAYEPWGEITGSSPKQRKASNKLKELGKKHADSNNWKNIWVEKKLGDAYEYRKGNTLSVTNGSTQEIKIGAMSIEEKYTGSEVKTYYMKSGGGVKEEEKYNRNTGVLVSKSKTTDTGNSIDSQVWKYDRTQGESKLVSQSHIIDTGNNIASYKFNLHTQESWTFDLGNVAAIHGRLSFNNQAKFDFDFAVHNFNFSTYLGTSSAIKINAAGGIGVSFSGGLIGNFKFPLLVPVAGVTAVPLVSFDLDLSSMKCSVDQDGLSVKFFGAELYKDPPVKLGKEEVNILRKAITIDEGQVEIKTKFKIDL